MNSLHIILWVPYYLTCVYIWTSPHFLLCFHHTFLLWISQTTLFSFLAEGLYIHVPITWRGLFPSLLFSILFIFHISSKSWIVSFGWSCLAHTLLKTDELLFHSSYDCNYHLIIISVIAWLQFHKRPLISLLIVIYLAHGKAWPLFEIANTVVIHRIIIFFGVAIPPNKMLELSD